MPGKPVDDWNMHLHVPTITKTYESILKLYNPKIVKLLGSASSQCLDNLLTCLQDGDAPTGGMAPAWLRWAL